METSLVKSESSAIAVTSKQELFFDLPPAAMVEKAAAIATVLSDIIEKQKLYTSMQGGRKHVQVEGWNTLGTFLGISPKEEWVTENPDGSFTASVELINNKTGLVVGRATHICGDVTDGNWHKRPSYAKRSMAVTRATGKAFRLSYSWIMKLAGYEATPAEEIPEDKRSDFFDINSAQKKKIVCEILLREFGIEDKNKWKLICEKLDGKKISNDIIGAVIAEIN
jgi:hypothetical protein